MILTFSDGETEDLFNGLDTRRARQRCGALWWPVARRKLTQLNRVRELEDLAIPPRNRMERQTRCGDGRHSVRVSDRFRVFFRWVDGHAEGVEIVDVHRKR